MIIDKLATSLKRKDETPNIELAIEIVTQNNKKAVNELVALLTQKNKDIRHDCIKVLYEIGERNPALIIDHIDVFVALLTSKNNRLQWGAMHTLSSLVADFPKEIYAVLPKILDAANKGSVITKDHAVKILISLCGLKQYTETAFALLNEQLMKAPTNQLPMYAENALPVITTKNKNAFVKTLTSRLDEIEKEPKRKRVEKVIKKCGV
jgi:hypothetical protein